MMTKKGLPEETKKVVMSFYQGAKTKARGEQVI